MPQLSLPIFAPPQVESIPIEKASPTISEVEAPSTEAESEDEWQALHDELEGLYLHLRSSMGHGPEFGRAWAKARAATCESYGVEVEAFYEELAKRAAKCVHLGRPQT